MTTTEAVQGSRSSPSVEDAALVGTARPAQTLVRRGRRSSWFVCLVSPLAWFRRWKDRRDLRRALQLLDTPGMIEHAHARDLMRLGDLCVRGGEPTAARRAYRRAATLFAADGHGQKSVALLKQVALLDPYDAHGHLDLARGLADLGRRREAALEYQASASLLEEKVPLEALQLLSLALALDPALPGAREQLAALEQTRRIPVRLSDEDLSLEMPGDPIPAEDFPPSVHEAAPWPSAALTDGLELDEEVWANDGVEEFEALLEELDEGGDFTDTEAEPTGEYDALADEAFILEPTQHGAIPAESRFAEVEWAEVERAEVERAEVDPLGESDIDAFTFEDEGAPEDATVAIELFTEPEELGATREYGAAHVDLLVSCAMDTSHASVVIEEEDRKPR